MNKFISHVGILKPKKIIYLVTERNRQDQTGTDKNRQDYVSDIEKYCTIKKFIYEIGNPEVRNRQEQTGLYF